LSSGVEVNNKIARIVCSLVIALTGACEDEELGALLPRVAIDACLSGTIEVGGETIGGVSDCRVDFGQVEFAAPIRVPIVVSNPSNVALRVNELSLSADSDPAFTLLTTADEIAASDSLEVVVELQPRLESQVSATLVLETDASNAPGDGAFKTIEIELTGEGVDTGLARVTISPERCAFGLKPPNSTSLCEVLISATGTASVILSDVEFEGESFSLVAPLPDRIPGGSAVSVGVQFTPELAVRYEGALRFGTNDQDNPAVEIPLTGAGSEAPVCDVVITAVNGVAITDTSPELEPLDDVVFGLETSHPVTPTVWEVVSRPDGSGVEPATPSLMTTGLVFDGTKFGIDVAGDYTVRATQTDLATGEEGSCEISFSAIPLDELLVQLTWSSPQADIDLHMIRQDDQGRFCARAVEGGGPLTEECVDATAIEDCYYWSCSPTRSLTPDWDEDGALLSDGDPSLDVDDRCGYGPENLNVDHPVAGSYLIGVDNFDQNVPEGCVAFAPVDVTVRVYTYGQLTGEWFGTVGNGGWWEVAVVHWQADGEVCIDDLAVAGDECAP
jgi:hypothetical protein